MFFDPQSADVELEEGGQRSYERARHPASEHRPSAGFLSVPDASQLPSKAILRQHRASDYRKLVLRQFQAGVLRAEHVEKPTDAGDAFAQAFGAWLNRHLPKLDRLSVDFVLLDAEATREQAAHTYDGHDFEPESPLYLGLELSNEFIYTIGDRVDAIRSAHPRLLLTAIALVEQASLMTVYVRTPEEFLNMVACWMWDGNSNCSDEDAIEEMKERFGEDQEEFERYLPSNVRAALSPDDARVSRYDPVEQRWRRNPVLGRVVLERLSRENTGFVRELCRDLLRLKALLSAASRRRGFRNQRYGRNLFGTTIGGNPIYPATTLTMSDNELVGQLLDDHYNNEMSGGEYTYFQGFAPIATEGRAIRRQFRDWKHALRVLGSLDRLLITLSS